MILPPLVFIYSRCHGIFRNQSPQFIPEDSVLDHGTNNLSRMHELEGIVDLVQWQHFADHFVDLDLAAEVAIHVSRQLRTALDAAERRAAPHATGDQLERAGTNFLTRAGNSDDNRFAPSLVATLK